MVQLKYFGDSRDYFKYDMISWLLKSIGMKNYVFVPMLTDHRDDNEGKVPPKHTEGKSPQLLAFIGDRHSKDLNHWETWLCGSGVNYRTVQPVNRTIFRDDGRAGYWDMFSEHLRTEDALVFLDPDTGLESVSQSYLKSKGREKYILDDEIARVMGLLDATSIVMIYQHLPKNKHHHESAVHKKVEQLRAKGGAELACAYREDDLAFLFAAKNLNLFRRLFNALADYHSGSRHPRKTLYLATGINP